MVARTDVGSTGGLFSVSPGAVTARRACSARNQTGTVATAVPKERRNPANGTGRSQLDVKGSPWPTTKGHADYLHTRSVRSGRVQLLLHRERAAMTAAARLVNALRPHPCARDRLDRSNPSERCACSIVSRARAESISTPGTAQPPGCAAVVPPVVSLPDHMRR